MKTTGRLTVLLLIACALAPERGASSQAGPKASLRFRLTARDTYRAGQPVTIGFSLENVSSEPLWVLKWYTPLEGLWGKILRVTRDGTQVPYQGPLAKRGPPRLEDYVRIEPGRSASAEIDLSKAYDTSVPGAYRVEFVGRVHDVARDGDSLPRRPEAQRASQLSGEPASFRVVAP